MNIQFVHIIVIFEYVVKSIHYQYKIATKISFTFAQEYKLQNYTTGIMIIKKRINCFLLNEQQENKTCEYWLLNKFLITINLNPSLIYEH